MGLLHDGISRECPPVASFVRNALDRLGPKTIPTQPFQTVRLVEAMAAAPGIYTFVKEAYEPNRRRDVGGAELVACGCAAGRAL